MTEPFRIGLSGCAGGLEVRSDTGLYELAELADTLGFDALWINEEHFQGGMSPQEGRRCLSPIVLAAALASRTQRIRLGFSVLLLPLHQPLRLAEEIASLDVLSNGRVDLGLSRGAQPSYASAFDMPPGDPTERFETGLTQMIAAWSEMPLQLADQLVQVQPKPVQNPHPPIYIGTYTPDVAASTARAGHRLICHGISNLDLMAPIIDAYAQAGGDLAGMPFGRFVYVSKNDITAREELWPTILALTNRLRGIGLHRRASIISEADLEPERFYETMVIAGGPETCVKQIQALSSRFGTRYLNALPAFFGHLPEPLLRSSLTLLATQVRPLLS